MRPSFLDNMSQQMAMVYEEVTDRILVNMARHFPYIHDSGEVQGAFEYQTRMLAQMGQVNRENVDIIAQSLGGADAALRQALESAIMEALKNEEPKMQSAAQLGLLGATPPGYVPQMSQAFQHYYRQSSDKLNLVNTVMLESTQAAYTATVSDVVNRINRTQGILNTAAGEVVTGVESWNQAVRNAVKKTIDNGLTGFIDHAGHRWSPEAYVAMDVRTTMFNTARAAVWEREEQYGCDTYQVSSHNGARPLCYPWQGKVISRTDTARDIEDLDGNKIHVYAQSETSYGEPAGLFGINCMHYPMTFIPGFSTLKGEPQEPEENEKTYEESQQQRELERKLRAERRDLAVMKAQGAPEAEIKAQRERVKKASQDIDDFCDETGRTRRRNREGTPVNAKFPNPDTYNPAEFPTEQRDRINDWYRNGNTPQQGQAQNVAQQATQEEPKDVQSDRYADFKPAETVQKAEEYADKFAYNVVYNGSTTPEIANAINRELDALTSAYPTNKLASIRQTGRISADAQANFKTLEFNAKKIGRAGESYSERQEKARKLIEEIGNMSPAQQRLNAKVKAKCETVLRCTRYDVSDPKNPIGSTVAHEYGHILADQYFGQINGSAAYRSANSQECRDARRLVAVTYNRAMSNGDAFNLSEYATNDEYEFVAEAFAARWIGEDLPDYIGDMLGTVFDHGPL